MFCSLGGPGSSDSGVGDSSETAVERVHRLISELGESVAAVDEINERVSNELDWRRLQSQSRQVRSFVFTQLQLTSLGKCCVFWKEAKLFLFFVHLCDWVPFKLLCPSARQPCAICFCLTPFIEDAQLLFMSDPNSGL